MASKNKQILIHIQKTETETERKITSLLRSMMEFNMRLRQSHMAGQTKLDWSTFFGFGQATKGKLHLSSPRGPPPTPNPNTTK